MKALILAAGQGSRLRPYTNDRPKGMLEINGKTILDHQIEMFYNCGISKIAVVKGYKAESVKTTYSVNYYLNKQYEITNMVQTILCAESIFEENEEVIVSYSDILYRESVLDKLIHCDFSPAVVVDKDWRSYYSERFGDPYLDAESLVMNERQEIESIGKPNPAPEEVQAQYIGLMKFNRETLEFIKNVTGNPTKEIGWGRNVHNCYVTDILQEIVWHGIAVKAVVIDGGWLEIDTLKDYELAEARFQRMLKVDSHDE